MPQPKSAKNDPRSSPSYSTAQLSDAPVSMYSSGPSEAISSKAAKAATVTVATASSPALSRTVYVNESPATVAFAGV